MHIAKSNEKRESYPEARLRVQYRARARDILRLSPTFDHDDTRVLDDLAALMMQVREEALDEAS